MSPMGAWEDGFAAGYRAGLRDSSPGRFRPDAERSIIPRSSRTAIRPKRTRAPCAYNKRVGAAIRRINKRAKKKDGNYRKGWNRAKVFKMAHKEAKR